MKAGARAKVNQVTGSQRFLSHAIFMPGMSDWMESVVKRAIFGENSARLYKYDARRRAELGTDRIALAKADYEREGPGRTNLRYGFVPKPIA